MKQNIVFCALIVGIQSACLMAMNSSSLDKLKVQVREGVFYAHVSPGEHKQEVFLPLGVHGLALLQSLVKSPASKRTKNQFAKREWPASPTESSSK